MNIPNYIEHLKYMIERSKFLSESLNENEKKRREIITRVAKQVKKYVPESPDLSVCVGYLFEYADISHPDIDEVRKLKKDAEKICEMIAQFMEVFKLTAHYPVKDIDDSE